MIYEMVIKKISFSNDEARKELLAHLMNEQAIGWHSVSPPPSERSLILRKMVQQIHQTLEGCENAE